jgi:DNA-binding beta-propeller fold protein YncE
VAVDARTHTAYAGNVDDSTIYLAHGRQLRTGHGGGCCGQYDLAVDPGLDTVYAVGIDDQTYRVDGTTGRREGALPVNLIGAYTAVDPRTHDVYVSGTDPLSARGFLAVVDGRTDRQVARLRLDAGDVAVDAARGTVLVSTPTRLLALDARTHRVTASVAVAGGLLAVDTRRCLVYVLTQDATTSRGSVVAVDERTMTVTRSAALPGTDYLSSIAVDPRSHAVLVSDYQGHRLVALSPGARRVVGRIPVGGAPNAIAVDPTTDRVYVATNGPGLAVLG